MFRAEHVILAGAKALSGRVEAAATEGIAAAHTPYPFETPAKRAMLFHGLNEVVAATGMKAAHFGKQGTEDDLIEAHGQKNDKGTEAT